MTLHPKPKPIWTKHFMITPWSCCICHREFMLERAWRKFVLGACEGGYAWACLGCIKDPYVHNGGTKVNV